MGPRRRRWRRRAAKAALAALGLAVLALLGSGRGEELLAAALAAWGEGRGAWGEGEDWGEWGMGEGGAGEAGDGNWGGGFVNGERGNGAGFVNGGRGNGAGFADGGRGNGAGFVDGEGAGVPNEGVGGGKWGSGVLNGSSRVTNGGPWGGTWGPGGVIGGPGGVIGGPGVGIGGPGGVIGGPGGVIGGPGVGIGGPGVGTGVPPPRPGCLGLLSGGSGDVPRGSPRPPKVLLSPPPCSAPAPFLLVLVPSAAPHLQRRLAVRDTWGGPWPGEPSGAPPARTVFVLGTPRDPQTQRELLAESRQHGDILQGDFQDSYANLTRKTQLLLRWARACCAAAPFLLKADDDVFVNVPAVATYLATWRDAPARLYLGRVHWRVAPNRDPRSRHHVPRALYPMSRYPPYCSGTAYVLSRQAAGAVLAAGARVPLALPEDVWVGVSAGRAGVAVRHSARFGGSARLPPERCCLGRALFSAHRLRPAELRELWARIPGASRDCGGLWALLGLLRCRAMALGEGLWGAEPE